MNSLSSWFKKKSNLIWTGFFVLLFLMSMDFWNWYISEPLILGLPFWVWYLLILTLFTSVAFYVFSKYQWGENK